MSVRSYFFFTTNNNNAMEDIAQLDMRQNNKWLLMLSEPACVSARSSILRNRNYVFNFVHN